MHESRVVLSAHVLLHNVTIIKRQYNVFGAFVDIKNDVISHMLTNDLQLNEIVTVNFRSDPIR